MKLKLNPQGFAVVRDGKPVYVHSNGREEAFDAAGAMKILIGKHFEASPIMAGLKIPPDVAAAFFGDSFRIEGGKLVALDKSGIQMYSGTRHGEVANFDEALAQLVDRYPNKDMIVRKDGSSAPGQQGQGSAGVTVTRAQFDAMPPATRAKFATEGGQIGEAGSAAPDAPAAAQKSSGKSVITRAQFDVMPPRERAAHFTNGGGVVD